MSPHQMPLLLVRHAVAEDAHPLGDEARALTAEGRAAFRAHARKLARLTPMTGIVTSPLVRAVQTAELLAEAFGLGSVRIDFQEVGWQMLHSCRRRVTPVQTPGPRVRLRHAPRPHRR